LDIADRVKPEFGGDAVGDDVEDEFGGLLGWVQAGVLEGFAAEPVEVAEAGELRGLAVVDAVRVDDDARLLGLAEELGETHPRDGVGGEQVAQDFAGADGGDLVDIANEQQMRSLGDRLDELVGRITSIIEASSTTTRSAFRGVVAVVFGSQALDVLALPFDARPLAYGVGEQIGQHPRRRRVGSWQQTVPALLDQAPRSRAAMQGAPGSVC